MTVQRFYDNSLAHASYAILSEKEIAVIDPSRDPLPYYKFAQEQDAKIVAVIETHLHADFISAHLEISQTSNCPVLVSRIADVTYPHIPFDEGFIFKLGKIQLKSFNTPGHSPDGISILLIDEQGKDHIIFTGDTLFVGDIGRPDLREGDGINTREELTRILYYSLHHRYLTLADEVLVYPAHGAGSLCGKNLSADPFSSIGKEKKENYALQPMTEEQFSRTILKDLPFTPKYFSKCVAINRKGAEPYKTAIHKIPRLGKIFDLDKSLLVVDTRNEKKFKEGHIPYAINIPDGLKFETWLGTIINPDEKFYLLTESENDFDTIISKVVKIGYEDNAIGILVHPDVENLSSPVIDISKFKAHETEYTIVDIRNNSERKDKPIFKDSLHIPLPELRDRYKEIPTNKPIILHCEGGYRSAIGSSILEAKLQTKVYDLSEDIKQFKSL